MASDPSSADGVEPRSDDPSRDGRDPPGPSGWPLIGATIRFVRDPFAFYEHCREAYESDVVHYRIAGDRAYMLTHPDDVQTVLVDQASAFEKGAVIRTSLGRVVPTGLVVTDGVEWQRDRRLLQPAFYRDRIEAHDDTMVRYTRDFAADWRDADRVRLDEQLRTLTLNVLAKTLLDVDVRDRESAIGRASDVITDRFDSSTLSAFLPLWVPTPANLRCKRAIDEFFEVIDDIVADRREDPGDREDLLSLLLTAEYPDGTTMEPDRVRDQLLTFLFAGHETTALALTYTLFLLATNPSVQERVHEELDAVTDGPPTAEDLDELDLLEAVVTESLRLYPPAFVVLREAATDVEIRGYEIPEGSVISLPQWNVHRDGRWYDDPEAFQPDRWLGGLADELPEYAYFPFGGGPRHCIGMRFALLEARLILATLCQHYRFEPVTEPPLALSMQITLQPDEPIEVVPRER